MGSIAKAASLCVGNRTIATTISPELFEFFETHHWSERVSKAALVRALLVDYALAHGYTGPVAPTGDETAAEQ